MLIAKLSNQLMTSILFIILIFFIAFFTGFVIIIFNRNKISFKNIIGGVLLGIPNYFSIYFVLLSLEYEVDTCFISCFKYWCCFNINNHKLFIHKENLNKIGLIVLACVSIFLLLSF